MRLQHTVLLLAVAGIAGCSKPPAAPLPAAMLAPTALQSPWDIRKIVPTQVDYACGQPVQLAPNIAIVDKGYHPGDKPKADSEAVYAQSSDAISDLAARLASAADAYQQTGSIPAANCAATLLAAAAADHAMAGWMFSRDAIHEQSKGLRSVSIGYLKIRNSGAISPDENVSILGWMEDVAHLQLDHYNTAGCSKAHCDELAHNAASAAFALASVGIANNDHSLFNWSLRKYRQIVSQIDGNGMLPVNLSGRTTLQYDLESVAALVQIAEYGEINNEPLYAYNHGAIHALVHTVTQGIVDPTPFVLVSHARQSMPKTLEGWEIGWATIYVRRFPDPLITNLLIQASDAGLYAWGGEPFGTEPDN